VAAYRVVSRSRSRWLVTAAYLVALGVAVAVGAALKHHHPVTTALVADLVATLVVFGCSMALHNSSTYDPYWSVAPVVIAIWYSVESAAGVSGTRQTLVIGAVAVWAIRLTSNWVRDWPGLTHEDWRYRMLRETGPLPWPLTSLLAVHVFPTIMVFVGCVPLWVALGAGTRPVGWLDIAAVAVMLGGALIEFVADEQMRRFRRTARPGSIMRSGLWARSRHPNYFGELMFWWGVWLAGLAASTAWRWTVVAPVAMVALFVAASVPMLDRRNVERRPGYDAVIRDLPALVPRGR
jgi:steroid 5-alpha reductase family enzyme